jgi:transposase
MHNESSGIMERKGRLWWLRWSELAPHNTTTTVLMTTAYLGLDLHASSSTLGIMAEDGTYQGDQQFSTAESELIPRVASVEASETMLAIEANSLSRWAARTLDAYVDRTVVCDPRENYLISRDARKSDRADAYNLCRLLRLEELKEVYQAEEDHRAVFKASAQHYLRCRKQQVALKQKIKATFRRWGVLDVSGDRIYKTNGREDYLNRLSNPEVERQLRGLYQMLDAALDAQSDAKKQMLDLGSKYPEITEFQAVPGVGPIGSHVFDALIQTPHRFSTKQKLWRYCQLGIRSQTSDGKPIGHEELDPQGRSELKQVSYQAWRGARKEGDNEVSRFYEQSLKRTGKKTNARLNTQRKILSTLHALWKHQSSYQPQRFLDSA